MIGQTVAHYKILEKLGEGGMGMVYRGVDTLLGRPVATKFLRPEAVGSTERKQRFILEAKAASALNHPHIITIYDIGRHRHQGLSVTSSSWSTWKENPSARSSLERRSEPTTHSRTPCR